MPVCRERAVGLPYLDTCCFCFRCETGIWMISVFQILYGAAMVIHGIARLALILAVYSNHKDKPAYRKTPEFIGGCLGAIYAILTGIFMVFCGVILMMALYWDDGCYFEMAISAIKNFILLGFIVLAARWSFYHVKRWDSLFIYEFGALILLHIYFLIIISSYYCCD